MGNVRYGWPRRAGQPGPRVVDDDGEWRLEVRPGQPAPRVVDERALWLDAAVGGLMAEVESVCGEPSDAAWLADALRDALRAAYRRGAEDMRERAAAECEARHDAHMAAARRSGALPAAMVCEERALACAQVADAIRALPVEPPEGTCGGC